MDKFLERKPKLHLLMNNAGIHVPGGDAPEVSGQRTPEDIEVCHQDFFR